MYKPDGSQLIKNIASDFSGKLVLALESSGHRSMSDIIQAGVGIASCEPLVSWSAYSSFSVTLACCPLWPPSSLILKLGAVSARWEMFIDPVSLIAFILCQRDNVRKLFILKSVTQKISVPQSGWLGLPPELMELHKWPASLHWEWWWWINEISHWENPEFLDPALNFCSACRNTSWIIKSPSSDNQRFFPLNPLT